MRRQVFPPDQLGALMAASDYVVMALPHTPATDKLVGPDALAALRPHAVLVNIGRGKTLDEDALVEGAVPHHLAQIYVCRACICGLLLMLLTEVD